jgi:hypothetical protein
MACWLGPISWISLRSTMTARAPIPPASAKLSGTARRSLATNTTLPTGHTNYYFRSKFTLAGAPQLAALQLQTVVATGPFFTSTARSTAVESAAAQSPLPRSRSRMSRTPPYLAPTLYRVHRWSPAPTSLPSRSTRRRRHEPSALRRESGARGHECARTLPTLLAFNEVSSVSNDNFWLELINYGSTDLDLAGCVLAPRRRNQQRLRVLHKL